MASAFKKYDYNFWDDVFGGGRRSRIEEEKRQTKELEAELYLETAETRIAEEQLKQNEIVLANEAKIKTILIVAIIIVIVMGGLYLIVKNK